MGWIVFVAGAVLSWGAYGVLLYLGGQQLGKPRDGGHLGGGEGVHAVNPRR